jgi:hypothetical protein
MTKLAVWAPTETASLEQVWRMEGGSVRTYSTERPHLSLQMQTPDALHRASLAGVCRLESSSQVSTSSGTGQQRIT